MGHRIQWVAGTIFALLFVGLLSLMNSSVLQYGSNVNNKINNTLSVSESYELQSFDNSTVTGETVISAINNCDTLFTRKMSIVVVSNGGTKSTYDESHPYSASGPSDPNYIGPSQKFTATLNRNTNNVITEVQFSYTT